jgi:enoyl-[acyl-carrier protein] reductase I
MNAGKDRFEMDISPWGEGDLRKNGAPIAHVTGRKNRREVFLAWKKIADGDLNASTTLVDF